MTAINHASWFKAPETQALIAAVEAARPIWGVTAGMVRALYERLHT